MDKLEEIRKIIRQPLEGLLYDLDLMPEQCKTSINELRSSVVECQYKEIEQLRKEKEWLMVRYVFALGTRKIDCRKQLIEEMEEELKEK